MSMPLLAVTAVGLLRKHSSSPAMTVPLWQRLPCMPLSLLMLAHNDCALMAKTTLHAKSSWPGPFTQLPVKIVHSLCRALTSRMAFVRSTSLIKQKAHLQCLRLHGKTAFLLAVLTIHLSQTHNTMLWMSLPAEHFNFPVCYYYQTRASHGHKNMSYSQLITCSQCLCTDCTTACLLVSVWLTKLIECSCHCPALKSWPSWRDDSTGWSQFALSFHKQVSTRSTCPANYLLLWLCSLIVVC